jgi:hypothetical protein
VRLRHEATYQGYPVKALLFRRGQGLGPEPGWVDILAEDLKLLKVFPRDIPWRPVGGLEVPGQLDIRTWYGLYRNETVTRPPSLPAPQGGGLNPFGDLVLSTFNDTNGALVEKVTYTDVYVDIGGAEEVGGDLAEIEGHEVGTVRVQITDLRRWWKYGALFCRINRKTKNGNWDKTSLNDGSPWPAVEVIRYLCHQLPGSPGVVSWSDIITKAAEFDPPTDIMGEGEPVVEHLQAALDHYGLSAGLLQDNNLVISRKYTKRLGYKEVPGKGGTKKKVPAGGKGLHYERKAAYQTDRPPAVVVTGPRRIKRVTLSYIPVLQYIDGRYYPLQTVLDFMGYDKFKLNCNVFNTAHRRFRDVKPSPSTGNDGRLHDKHRSILEMAYRLYAPAALFPQGGGSGSAMPDLHGQVHPFLPMTECAWYVRELGGKKLSIPLDGGKGDDDDYVLLNPIARGYRRGVGYFREFELVEQYFKARIEKQEEKASLDREYLKSYRARLQTLVNELTAADDQAKSNFKEIEVGGKWGASNAAKSFNIDQDLANAIKQAGFGTNFDKGLVQKKMADPRAVVDLLAGLTASIQNAEARLGESDKVVQEWRTKFDVFKAVYLKRGGVDLMYNLPYDVLDDAIARVDPDTGILTSGEPLCLVDKPFFGDGDSVVVVADGSVTVTFGHELKENNIGAYTAFLFSPTQVADDEPAQAVFAGVCRASPIKALGVPMNGRMYLLDEGTPVNFNACLAEAYGKAAPLLGVPAAAGGFTYEVDGFRDYWLDGGVSSIQHSWDGERTPAYTFVAVNSPGARLPGGPPMVPTVDRRAVRAQQAQDRDRERTN